MFSVNDDYDNVRATNKNIIQNYKWKKKEDLEKGNDDLSWVEVESK